MSRMVLKLKRLKGIVNLWEKNQKKIRTSLMSAIDCEILTLLEACPYGILTKAESDHLTTLKAQKEKLLVHESLTWKLKSRVNWIELGDANTKFFHGFASARKNFNAIWAI